MPSTRVKRHVIKLRDSNRHEMKVFNRRQSPFGHDLRASFTRPDLVLEARRYSRRAPQHSGTSFRNFALIRRDYDCMLIMTRTPMIYGCTYLCECTRGVIFVKQVSQSIFLLSCLKSLRPLSSNVFFMNYTLVILIIHISLIISTVKTTSTCIRITVQPRDSKSIQTIAV